MKYLKCTLFFDYIDIRGERTKFIYSFALLYHIEANFRIALTRINGVDTNRVHCVAFEFVVICTSQLVDLRFGVSGSIENVLIFKFKKV